MTNYFEMNTRTVDFSRKSKLRSAIISLLCLLFTFVLWLTRTEIKVKFHISHILFNFCSFVFVVFFGNTISDIWVFFKERSNARQLEIKFISTFKYFFSLFVDDIIMLATALLSCILIYEKAFILTYYHLCFIVVFLVVSTFLSLHKNKITPPEISAIAEKHNFNIGYGAAFFYYHNYLKNFIPYKFQERIRHFCSEQQVAVPEKLFILLPESCIVKKYIDNNKKIERARELPSYTLDIAGIKNREYNITVYQVLKNVRNDSIWCAVEYAQPLRQLYDLRKSGKISIHQMKQERLLFIQTLKELLHDENDSHQTCALLFYDDEKADFNEAELLIEAHDENSMTLSNAIDY